MTKGVRVVMTFTPLNFDNNNSIIKFASRSLQTTVESPKYCDNALPQQPLLQRSGISAADFQHFFILQYSVVFRVAERL